MKKIVDYLTEVTIMGTIAIHNDSGTTYDNECLKLVTHFLNDLRSYKMLSKKYINFRSKVKEPNDDYIMIVYRPSFGGVRDWVFATTESEAYTKSLNADDANPSYIKIIRKNGITNYKAAVENPLFGKYDGMSSDLLYDDNGHLQQFVMDNAIDRLEQDLYMDL